jgi:hypothetical protein
MRCKRLETWRRLNGADRRIGERELQGEISQICDGSDGGYVFQYRQKDLFDLARIGKCPVFSSIRNF